tara:strand:+ start:19 stop:1098 length:1080 start_codon:yes stop_codon:yes gene_type:complete
MTLPTSGNPIKFSEIESEFGGAPNNNLGAYRINAETYGGKSFSTLDTDIPSSGTIKFGDFHGKKLNVVVDCHTDCADTRVNARTEYNNNNVNCVGSGTLTSPAASRNASDSSGHKVFIRVNKTIGSASGNVNNCALRTGSFESGTTVALDVGSSGKIVGAGGNGGAGGDHGGENGGNGGDGTSALGIEYNGTAVIVESGGLIVCGFGGGGGGGSGRDEDPGADRTAGGGGGGGGAGLPAGEGGSGGTEGSDSGNSSHVGGSSGSDADIPAGGEESGGGGSGGNNANEVGGGSGGRGGDQENAASAGGDSGAEGGSAGGNGSAIRKANDEIAYTFSESGSETGGTANTGSESGGSHIGVA